jgi:hypothetical protein
MQEPSYGCELSILSSQHKLAIHIQVQRYLKTKKQMLIKVCTVSGSSKV